MDNNENYVSPHLLDELVWRANCDYLSDLRNKAHQNNLSSVLPEADEFSLEQWNEVIAYICSEDSAFSTQEAAREYLLHQLLKEDHGCKS